MTMQELLAQKAELEAQIAAAKVDNLLQAAERVRQIAQEHAITLPELMLALSDKKDARAKVKPKWRNTQTGETWTGRGKRPKWFIDGAEHIAPAGEEAPADDTADLMA